MKHILPSLKLTLPAVAAVCLLTVGTGCTLFRNMGTGARMDKVDTRPRPRDSRTRTMVVEITTDLQGQVATIRFIRTSGKDAIDEYVAETIKQSWPQQPSLRTTAEVTYSQEKGFSEPKILSTTPA